MKKLTLALGLLSGLTLNLAMANDCPEGRLFKHESGETCIKEAPKKVVVLEYSFADHLGVLGEKPAGYAKDAMPKYLEPIVAGSEIVGKRKAPSLEKIAALNPDLIIADKKRHTGIYEQLSAIAPTIIHNSLRGNYDDQMNSLKQIADIYNKRAIADKAIADLEKRINEFKAEAHNNSVLIDVFRPGQHSIHSNQSFMGSILERVGKTVPVKVRDGQTQFELDLEGVASVNPDAILIMCTEKSQDAINTLMKNPVVEALKATKNGNIYFVSKTLWSKGRAVKGLNLILDDMQTNGFLANTPNKNFVCIN